MSVRVHDDWLLTPFRAAVHLPTATAAVADLHLGYEQARRGAGEAVPLPDLDRVLAPLARLCATCEVRRLAVAGDLFEDRYCPELTAALLDRLGRLRLELTAVVPGNHDRGLAAAAGLPLRPGGFALGRWRLVHGDRDLPAGPCVLGHWHPCLRWPGVPAAPCYLTGPGRIVLPAFSRDAAGVNVRTQRRWHGHRCHVIVSDDVLDFGLVAGLREAAGGGKSTRRRSGP